MLTSILISSFLFVVNSANEVEAVPEKSLDNALQADAGSYLMDHIGKIEAAISDNSKSLSSIRQAVEANTKVEAVPEKSLDKALQADAGSEIMKHLAMMELSNMRQAVEAVGAVEANTKVPETIHYNKIQADIGDDLMKELAKMKAAIKSNTEKFQSNTEKIGSNTEKIGSNTEKIEKFESKQVRCLSGHATWNGDGNNDPWSEVRLVQYSPIFRQTPTTVFGLSTVHKDLSVHIKEETKANFKVYIYSESWNGGDSYTKRVRWMSCGV